MPKIKTFLSQHKTILLIMFLAACARLIDLGGLPGGVYPDEAYNAYNTWSMMTEGIDSRGYHTPVYFVAWGSGMNVLYAYLALPFFRLFGASLTVFRLPQALVSLAGVFSFYVLGRECFDRKMGCFMAFALAINPWSVMNARFGLESTLAPSMILFALTFLVLGLKKNANYLYASAIFMAASLYSYALTWIALPIILILTLLLYWKRIPRRPATFLSVGILFAAAVPLLLFLAVNLDLIPEIATPFFSIPRLAAFRSSELNLRYIFSNLAPLSKILLRQYDSHSHASSALVGAYYLFTTPFFLLGIVLHIGKLLKKHERGNNDLQFLLLIWLASAFFVALLQSIITMIHINLIHIPLIFYGVYGITEAARIVKSRFVIPACVTFFCISFAAFFYDYATDTDTHFYRSNAMEALEEAKNLAKPDQTVTIVGYLTVQCGVWMWWEKPLPSDFCANVTYIDDPAWGQIGSYGQFQYVYSIDQITGEDIYILQRNAANLERLAGMDLTVIPLNSQFLIAYPDTSCPATP
ncbi:MAG: glycosyltransferase family 39 protein [Blautia sp.]|nr:glycosyltransferase family 39 protein [Blautia sp.]